MDVGALTPARARLGVALQFFTNGIVFSSLPPRYPELKAAWDLGDAAFGLVVASFTVGSALAAAWAAPLIRRYGAREVATLASVLLAVSLWAALASPTLVLLLLFLLLAGLIDAVVDAAQNVQGVAVERWCGTSIINGLHAVWSLGAVCGGLFGTWSAAQHVPLVVQLGIGGAVCSLLALVAGAWSRVPGQVEAPARPAPTTRPSRRTWLLLAPIVLVAVWGVLPEEAASNWSALYLGREAGAPAHLVGWAFTVALGAQCVGRFLGDVMTNRWGRVAVARWGGLTVAAGLAVVIAAPSVPGAIGVALAGFAAMGLGSATLVPAAFAAADRVPGLPHGTGIAVLGWMMRVGYLMTPPLMGAISQATSLRVALFVPLLAGLGVAWVAHRYLRPAVG